MRNRNLSQLSIKAEGGLSFIPKFRFRSPVLGLILLAILTGCHTDNRVRINPPIEIKLSAEKKAELRIYVMRRLYEQAVLKEAEIWMTRRTK